MAKIISRGEEVYSCDVCNRYVRLPDNPLGLNILHRCIITKGCLGSLHKVLNKKLISQISTITPSVEGVADWFQRKIVHTHTQTAPTKQWVFDHDLGSIPVVQVFIDRGIPNSTNTELLETELYTQTSTSTHTTINFDVSQTGIAQCLALSSTTVQPKTVQVTTNVQLTNKGELTIATLDSAPAIGLTVRYTDTNTGETIDVRYFSVDNSPSILSPWASISNILLNGKRYYVRSFNIATTPGGNAFFASGRPLTSGFSITFPELESTYNTNVILLAASPYTAIDKITNSFIDIATVTAVQSSVVLVGSDLVSVPSIIRDTYPPILPL